MAVRPRKRGAGARSTPAVGPVPAVPPGAPISVTNLEQMTALEKNLDKIKEAIANLAKVSETQLNEALKIAASPNFQLAQLRPFNDTRTGDKNQREALQTVADKIEKQLPALRKKFKAELKAKVEKEQHETKEKLAKLKADLVELNK